MYRFLSAARALALLAGGIAIAPAPVQAQYPDRPIRLVIPFAAGGVNDIIGRLWAEKVRPSLGTVVVENRGGAGGTIGASDVAKAAPDGYTVLLGNISTMVLNPEIMRRAPYDPLKDFETVSILAGNALSIVVHPSVPATTLKELIAHVKANPGKLSYGSAGAGTMTNLAGELFKRLAGLDIVHVAYKGAGAGRTDLLGGHIPMMTPTVTGEWLALHRTAKVRMLAVTGPTRLKGAPEIPTALEAGLPRMVALAFSGLWVPAGTPKAIIQRLDQETQKVLAQPEFQELLIKSGFEPMLGLGLEKGRDFLRQEHETWIPVIRATGMKQR